MHNHMNSKSIFSLKALPSGVGGNRYGGSLALSAVAEDFNQNFLRLEFIFPADLFLQFLQSGILKFSYFPTFQTNQVIVLALLMDRFVMLVLFPVNHLVQQARLHQKRQGAVDGRPGDAASLLPKAKGKLVGFEVPLHRQGFPQNLLPLGSPFQSALFNIFYELRAGFPIHIGSPMTFNSD